MFLDQYKDYCSIVYTVLHYVQVWREKKTDNNIHRHHRYSCSHYQHHHNKPLIKKLQPILQLSASVSPSGGGEITSEG